MTAAIVKYWRPCAQGFLVGNTLFAVGDLVTFHPYRLAFRLLITAGIVWALWVAPRRTAAE